jgi:hypothetical protein
MSENVEIGSPVGESTRRALETVGDHLIPEAHGMPAASAMMVGTAQLDVVLSSRPDLAPFLERALADADLQDVAAFLSELRTEDPQGYDAVTLAVVAGYYMHPKVHELIGYPGQVPKDSERLGEREIYQEGLMELAQKVIDRGPIYRPTPTTAQTD